MTTALDILENYKMSCDQQGIKPQLKKRKPIKIASPFPEVRPAPGFEKMYADYTKRKYRKRRARLTTKVLHYPKVSLHPYNPLPRWPNHTIKVPPTHKDDLAWMRKHPDIDRFLAACEVAGHIARRYASWLGDGQIITFPAHPGSLDHGRTVEWTAAEIMANLFILSGNNT